MNWRFWHSSATAVAAIPVERLNLSATCDHLWSDWSDPEPYDVTLIQWNGERMELEKHLQVRRCFSCNRHERIVV